MPVYSPHRTYDAARVQWDRCRDVYAGTDAVKRQGVKYLPMLEGHVGLTNSAPYLGYKERALFYPAMSKTVYGLAGLVFGKPATITGIPDTWLSQFDDVTLTGVSLPGYGLELCYEALITGRVGTLLDMPDGEPSAANRPYWVTYAAENIVNWRVTRIGGKQTLTMVVLAEEKETANDKDPFIVDCVRQFRVLELIGGVYQVSLWTEGKDDKKGQFFPEEKVSIPLRRGKPLNYIPFVYLGASGIGPEIDHPPLLDLVDVNLSHYRTSADQEHGAHFTALPTPYVTGHKLEAGTTLGIGSGTAWVFENPQAQAGMVEFTGAGLKSLADIKEEKRLLMATLGARMLETQKNAQEAAQTVAMRHAGERSALSVLADALGQALSIGLRWHLYWIGVDEIEADKAKVTLNPDVMDQLTAADIQALVTTWQAGAISKKTVYHNLEWGEWTRPGVNFEQEELDIEEEAPEPNLGLAPAAIPAPAAQLPKTRKVISYGEVNGVMRPTAITEEPV